MLLTRYTILNIYNTGTRDTANIHQTAVTQRWII